MKLKTSKSHIDKIILNSKIFHTIKFPENKKGLSDIQKYLSQLGNSVKLLNNTKSNDKIIQRNSIHISRSVLLKNKKEENKSSTYEINDDYKSYNKSKIRTKYCSDKTTLLKERNELILNRILKNKEKSESNIIKVTDEKIRNSKKEEIFVTSFDFPKVKEKNDKKGVSGILKADLNETNKKTINSRFRNYRLSLPKIGSDSIKGNTIELPNSPNRIKSHIIRPNISFNKKIDKNKLYTKEENTDINNINPKEKLDKLNLHQLNKKLISLFGYDFKNPTPISPQIGNFLKKLKKIKLLLNKKNCEYELDKWIMRSKMKYVKWKFGIDDLEKYFMNVDEFGIKEKNELELRKSFYKKLNILIDELKEEKEMRKIKEREKAYGINANNEEKDVIKNIKFWNGEKAMNIMKEQSKILKMTKQRKIKEQKNREIIESILIKTKQRAFNINNY